jgi:uncharacterized protein (TIRG00374 family)
MDLEELKDLKDSKVLWFSISTAIILVMVYLADFSKFMESISQADPYILIPAFVTGFSVFGLWSYVWYHFLTQMDVDVSLFQSFKMFMAGHFLNSIFPMGQFGGEPFMAYIISDNTEASYGKSFSAVFSSDLVNTIPGFTFMSFGAIYLFQTGSITDSIFSALIQLGLLISLAVLIGYLVWFRPDKLRKAVQKITDKITDLIGRGEKIADKIEEGIINAEKSLSRVGESPAQLLKITLIAHIGFVLQLACLIFILIALNVEYTLIPLFFVLNLSAFANFSPTPGGAGTYEAAFAGLLVGFISVGFAEAAAAGIIFRMTTYWLGLVVGYVSINSLEGEINLEE